MAGVAGKEWQFGPFRLDTARRRLERAGELVELRGKAFDALVLLVQNRGRPVSRAELMDALWPETSVEEANLTQAISVVRRALGDQETPRRYVETISGVGYQFVASVEEANVPRQPGMAKDAGNRSRSLAAAAVFAAVMLAAAWGASLWGPTEARIDRPLEPVPLTSYPGNENHPDFSPEGTRVAFSWNAPDRPDYDIYVKTIGSENPVRLTGDGGAGDDRMPDWSPDGSRIAFLRDEQVYTISAKGGSETLIADVRGLFGNLLEWAPDGESLLLKANDPNGKGSYRRLWLEDRRIEEVFPPMERIGGGLAAYSPDGNWLAYVRFPSGEPELHVMPAGGGAAQVVASVPGWLRGLAWSPDGGDLIYSSGRPGFLLSLRRVPSKGGRDREISGLGLGTFEPAVSSSTNRLAYTQGRALDTLWRYSLTNKDESPQEWNGASTYEEIQPRVSPDGKRVAFVSSRSGSRDVWIADLDGSNLQRVTQSDSASTTCWPAWSPDGRYIAYRNDASYLRVLNLESGPNGE